MNLNRHLITLISFLLSLWLGFWVGKGIISLDSLSKADKSAIINTQPAITELPTSLSFIWVGIEDLRTPSPVLKTIWWVNLEAYSPVKMVPLYPRTQQPDSQDQQLLDTFSILQQDGLYLIAQAFLDTLGKAPNWDTYLVTDEIALENLIDMIGGVNLGKGLLNGHQALKQINSASQIESYLNLQTVLWGEICWNTSRNELDTSSLVKVFKNHSFAQPGSILEPSDWPGLLTKTDIPACSFPLATSAVQPTP